MIVEDLRKSILDSLLYGKFITKNLSKIKKNLDISSSEFPVSWKLVQIGSVIDIARGGSPRPIKSFLTTSEKGINWIKIGDTIKGSKYIDSCKEKIIEEGISKSRFVHKGDFLLSNSMSFGRPYILNIDGCIHDGWLVLTDKNELFLKDYLFYVLSSDFVYKQFSDKASGAVVSNLNTDKVRETIIPLPPIEEQQRLVNKIESLFAKLNEIKPIEEELMKIKSKFPEDMKNSILLDAFLGNWSKDTEGKWDEFKLNSIADICTGNSISETIKKSKYTNLTEGYNYIGTKDLKFNHSFEYDNGVKIPYNENGFKYAEVNDILMCIEGGSAGKKIGILNEKVCFGNKLCKFSSNDNIINFKFLYYYLQSPIFLRNFNENLSGIIGGVSINKIKQLVIRIPSLKEQQRLVDKLEQLLPLCDDIDNLL